MLKFRTAILFVSMGLSLQAGAEVIRFDVVQSGPAFDGRSFGSVGPYVKITARATIAVDPTDPRNAVIADIDRAPRNADGRVEATADVVLAEFLSLVRGEGSAALIATHNERIAAKMDRVVRLHDGVLE